LTTPALPPLPPLPPQVQFNCVAPPISGAVVLALFPLAAIPLQVFAPFAPLAPVTDAEPATNAHRRNVTSCDAFTSAA
jgi:hypothetical protein